MHKFITLAASVCALLLAGCGEKPLTKVANVGNAGSLNGFYVISDVSVQTVRGGWVNFGYGAVNGYPGASAGIGMGVPSHIAGSWSRSWKLDDKDLMYYRIDAPIDAALAEQKIRTLNNYYQTFKQQYGSMQVMVDEKRIQVMYTLPCYSKINDCTPKPNADPNHWVTQSPTGTTEVVVLFDGQGESSPTPFEKIAVY